MGDPAHPIAAANALVVGKSGAGKSTLCNLLLYDQDDVPNGFAVGDSPDSMTKQCVTKSRCGLPTCLQVHYHALRIYWWE